MVFRLRTAGQSRINTSKALREAARTISHNEVMVVAGRTGFGAWIKSESMPRRKCRGDDHHDVWILAQGALKAMGRGTTTPQLPLAGATHQINMVAAYIDRDALQ